MGAALPSALPAAEHGPERIADVPIYATDALVRRAESLQLTADARAPVASLPSALWAELGLQAGEPVRITQGGQTLIIAALEDPSLAPGAVRVPAGHADTATLGPMFGPLTVTRA
jgi:NADH-quinone oxidoreductase subunit G